LSIACVSQRISVVAGALSRRSPLEVTPVTTMTL
jgi:hypothetical protein